MNQDPVVSVIMTVYNGERFVEEAIHSILNQTLRDIEIVVVDDGSTDHTPDILAKFTDDRRVKLITSERIGRGKALNVAWHNASGRYIANLDADDMSHPERLEKQAEYLDHHPGIGLLGTASTVIDEIGNNDSELHRPLNDETLKKDLIKYNPFVHSSVMIPRHVLIATNGYNENLPVTIDYELWVRISKHYKVANLPDLLTIKRTGKAAFFRNMIPRWVRYKYHVIIRWRAWGNNSYSILYAHHVAEAVVRYIVARTRSIIEPLLSR